MAKVKALIKYVVKQSHLVKALTLRETYGMLTHQSTPFFVIGSLY